MLVLWDDSQVVYPWDWACQRVRVRAAQSGEGFAMNDLTQLTRFEDRLTFLYLEKGHIEQHQTSVAYVTENHRRSGIVCAMSQ